MCYEFLFLGLSFRLQNWTLSSGRNSNGVTTVRSESVRSRMGLMTCKFRSNLKEDYFPSITYCCTVIPYGHIVLAPLKTSVQLLRCCNHLGQIADNSIALCFRNSNNFSDKAGVEEKAVPASHWVGTDQRMHCRYWLAPNRTTRGSGIRCLHVCGMNSG